MRRFSFSSLSSPINRLLVFPVTFSSQLTSEAEFPNFFEGISDNSSVSPAKINGSAFLELDGERGELVKASAAVGRDRAAAALKNHSEAEKRRRERINGHLINLRSLIPGAEKMDKASLLAKAINHLKELKKNATEASRGLVIPLDADEVRVEEPNNASDGTHFCIKASICCEYRHEIFSDLRRALSALQLKMVRAEVATLGSRMKNIFVVTGFDEDNIEDAEVHRYISRSVHQALQSVLDRFSASQELSSRDSLSNKRRRLSCLNYSISYSSLDL